MLSSEQQESTPKSHFIVCGLGSLGQHCVKLLRNFDVPVIAIDKQEEIKWEVNGIPHSSKNNYIPHSALQLETRINYSEDKGKKSGELNS